MEGLGGGAVVAFAAVLWLLYLAPSWVRRRQYLATERNAVRLQQTLRILAETAEIPDEVRAELSARSVAEQHRVLRESAQQAEAVSRSRAASAERSLRRRSAPPREPRRRADAVSAITSARLRRSRLLATSLLLTSLGMGAFGIVRAQTAGQWLPLVAGVVGALGALALLQRAAMVAAASRAVHAVDRAVSVPEAPQSFTDWQASGDERPTWTPVPLPKARRVDREEAPADAAAVPREAAPRADRTPAAAATAERRRTLEQLGIHDTAPQLTDLDAVLRRRRAS